MKAFRVSSIPQALTLAFVLVWTLSPIYVGVMTRWRPKRGWFESETPRLFAIARRTDLKPELVEVWKRNWPA